MRKLDEFTIQALSKTAGIEIKSIVVDSLLWVRMYRVGVQYRGAAIFVEVSGEILKSNKGEVKFPLKDAVEEIEIKRVIYDEIWEERFVFKAHLELLMQGLKEVGIGELGWNEYEHKIENVEEEHYKEVIACVNKCRERNTTSVTFGEVYKYCQQKFECRSVID